ncbi:hypothetical protein DFQ30_003100 [Apophysomyces sp. BC1015]|nr:hypothetical protein DFQ30_003100 [Apophysomyces sp. BC1015]KAG0179484.1 hypothetical protein DFQ29_002028 [Apophysomyces sp. BC1021]
MSNINNLVNSPTMPMNVDSVVSTTASFSSLAPGLSSTELGEMRVQHLQQRIQCYMARCQELGERLESDFDTEREKEPERALLECEGTTEAHRQQLCELEETLRISSSGTVTAESAGLGGSLYPITHGVRKPQLPMVDPVSLPILKWRTPQALQRFAWSLCPPGCDETYLPANWPILVQKAMNGSQIEWYRGTFLQQHQNLANVTWTLFCEDFLALFGSSSAFLYEPLEKFLEYAHIRMDHSRGSIDVYSIRVVLRWFTMSLNRNT